MLAITKHHITPLLVIAAVLMFDPAAAQIQNDTAVYELNAVPTNVSLTSTNLPFIIRSPNYGRGKYPEGINYTLTIYPGATSFVLGFYFRAFDLEYQDFCSYDALTLQGVKYCGNWETRRSVPFFLPKGQIFTVNFKTDGSIPGTGFDIIVIPEPGDVKI